MIVVCAGDSFTYGAELWEEKHVPNYKNFTFEQANKERSYAQMMDDAHAQKVASLVEKNLGEDDIDGMIAEILKSRKLKRLDRERDRKDYAYSSHLRQQLSCEVHNIGISGGSELAIFAATVQKIYELRKLNPNRKIILVMQHTAVERIWVGRENNFSLIMSHDYSPNRHVTELEFYETKYTYLSYLTKKQNMLEYDMQLFAIMKICEDLKINLVQFFTMFDCEHNFISNHESCLTKNMSKKLLNYYSDGRYLLPMKHFTCESHELIAKWIVDHMKSRKIL